MPPTVQVSQPFVCRECRPLQENWNRPCKHAELYSVLVDCDSELSAQGHGRPAGDKAELLRMSGICRKIYEGMKRGDENIPLPVRIAEAIEKHFGNCICIEGYSVEEAADVIALELLNAHR